MVSQHGMESHICQVPAKLTIFRTSLAAQWLRLCAPNAGGPGSIPGQGTRSHMHAATKSSHATIKEHTAATKELTSHN